MLSLGAGRPSGVWVFYFVFSRSVGRFFLTCFNLFILAETMVNERPSAVDVLDKHRQKAAERKGRCSLELLKQCFERVVRQAHVLYGGSPPTGEFDL